MIDPFVPVYDTADGRTIWTHPDDANPMADGDLVEVQGHFGDGKIVTISYDDDLDEWVEATLDEITLVDHEATTEEMFPNISREITKPKVVEKAKPVCECGAVKARTTHAKWCPMY
jgi:hypothetical protein